MKKHAILLVIVSLLFSCVGNPKKQSNYVFSSFEEMVEVAKTEIEEISIPDFYQKYTGDFRSNTSTSILIDIRTKDEYNKGSIPGAFLIQRGIIEAKIDNDDFWEKFQHPAPQKTDEIVLYCNSGNRSALATKSLKKLGYSNVKSLEGGWKNWHKNYPELIAINKKELLN